MTSTARIACTLLLALGTTVGPYALAPAYAATDEYECVREDIVGKLFLRLDTAAGTVASWHRPANPGEAPIVKALITKEQVSWTDSSGGIDLKFTLDRNSLALSEVLPQGEEYSWACSKTAPAL